MTNQKAFGAALWAGPVVLGILFLSLAADQPKRESPSEPRTARESASAPEQLELAGVENAYRLSPRLYSGGEPRGAEAFFALQKLGIRTVISVDGAAPDVEAARMQGIRYVHIPIGYDGVPRAQAIRIIKAARLLPGPVYVHCHHGKHRGPAAVAVCGLATEGWSEAQALSWLEQAGTSPEYRGLYADVKGFVPPTPEELEAANLDLPERAKVAALVELMVRIDAQWDRLKAVQKAGFQAPADHPDIDPPHEALQLLEHFREATRLAEVRVRGEDFSRLIAAAERQATNLRDALREYKNQAGPDSRKQVEEAIAAMSRSCTGCHARYRDH